jgi:ferredoxin-NADP reductase
MRVNLTLVGTKQETPDLASFLFTREAAFTWRAGQFLRYTLPHPHPDERKTTRCFTNASAPFEQRVMLTTRFAPERGSSFKRALRELPLGTMVEVVGPSGDFGVESPEVDHVFIAGGIGITPYRAILLDRDHRERPVNVTLPYANRSPDVVYKGELEALAAKHPRLTIHDVVAPEQITEQVIRTVIPDPSRPMFYVSGPEPMSEAVGQMVAAMSIPAAHVKQDFFPRYVWP